MVTGHDTTINTIIFDKTLHCSSIVVDKMDSLNGATLIKADGSKVEAEKALENKVGPSQSLE